MLERKDGNKKLTEPRSHKESETRRTTKSHKPFPNHGCRHCGDIEYHDFQFCLNRGIRCGKCNFIGHNAASCFSKKRVKEKIRRDKENRDQKNTRDKSMVNPWKGDRSRSSAANERRKSRRHQEYEIAPPRTQEPEGTTYSPVQNGSATREISMTPIWGHTSWSLAPRHPKLPGHPTLPIRSIDDPGTAREQAERWILDDPSRRYWAEEQETKWRDYFYKADRNPAGPRTFRAEGQEQVDWWENFLFDGSKAYGPSPP